MKAWYIGISLLVLISACSLVADAKPKHNESGKPDNDPPKQHQFSQNNNGPNNIVPNQPNKKPIHNSFNQPNNTPGYNGTGQTDNGVNYKNRPLTKNNQAYKPNEPDYNTGYNNSPGYNGTGQPNYGYDNQVGYNNGPRYQNNQSQQDARSVLQRTAVVLNDAQRVAKHGRYNTGLGQAVAHQEMARDLYNNGSYQDAIYHSLRARRLAQQVLAGNGERSRSDYSCNPIEQDYSHRAPRDADLDCRLNPKKVSSDAVAILLIIALLTMD